MANPTIGATTPRIQYTATASQTVFSVPFEFLANADLAVYVNGTLKTLTTDYTLTGANTTGGGTLTFVTGRTAGEIITILGNLAYSRDTNKYTKYGLLPAEVLEADFDALQVQAKQLALADQFAIRAPLTDTGSPSMTLPVVATRASKVLGFDASGNPTTSSSTVGAMDAAVTAINTIASAAAGSSASISHIASGTGAVATTVQAKLRNIVGINDFDNSTNYDTAKAALTGRNDMVVRPSSESTDILLSVAVDATRSPIYKSRTAPHANFSWFTSEFSVIKCSGPGEAVLQQDLKDVFLSKFSSFMTGSTTYVDGTNGSDANPGTITQPWATIDKAIRTSNSGTVYVLPGTYDAAGFRYTDTQGDRPKMLIAPYGGVTITTPGDVIASATWTANGTYALVYQTTLSTSNHVIRVLDSTRVDELGLPIPMPRQASLVDVNSSGYGWWYDSVTKILYVRINALNVETNKARLSAIYATGGDNQMLIYAANLYLENITIDKYLYVLNVAGQVTPQVWMKNCTIRYAASNSRNVQGGYCYSQGCTYYRGTADHANYNIANSVVSRGVEINDTTWYAGDVDSFGSGATQPNNPVSTSQNKNSSSNHDSYVVRVNGTHRKSYGPVIADTDTSYSWNLGVVTEYSYATTTAKYGWIVQGSSAKAWLDGCSAGSGNSGFNSDLSAVAYIFNSFGAQVTSTSGSFSSYLPA